MGKKIVLGNNFLKVLFLNHTCTYTNFYFELGGNLSHITQIPQTMFLVPQTHGCITCNLVLTGQAGF